MWLDDLAEEADAAALADDGIVSRPQIDRCRAALPRLIRGRDRRAYRAAPTRDGRRGHAVKLLLGEDAEALHDANIQAVALADLGLAGRSDPDVFAAAAASGYVLLSENVADFARIPADHLNAGRRHAGVLIALSSRFSRRPAGCSSLPR